eukprot:3562492-Rhodomonas_salina.1
MPLRFYYGVSGTDMAAALHPYEPATGCPVLRRGLWYQDDDVKEELCMSFIRVYGALLLI